MDLLAAIVDTQTSFASALLFLGGDLKNSTANRLFERNRFKAMGN